MREPKPIQPDEARALDELEDQVANGVGRRGMKYIAEYWVAVSPSRPVEAYPTLIKLAEKDPFLWEMLQAELAHQRQQRSPESIDSPLLDWALEIALDERMRPKRQGRQVMTNAGRNGMIVLTVDKIRRMGHRPATSNKLGWSACDLVAKRLHRSYEAVRSIWQSGLSHMIAETLPD